MTYIPPWGQTPVSSLPGTEPRAAGGFHPSFTLGPLPDPPPWWAQWGIRESVYDIMADGTWVIYPQDLFGINGDDAALINYGLAQTGKVGLAALTYTQATPIVMSSGMSLRGASGFGNPLGNFGLGSVPLGSTVLQAAGGFTGTAMIHMASSGAQQGGQQIRDLCLDGSTGPGAINGIEIIGTVASTYVGGVVVFGGSGRKLTYCFLLTSNADGNPDAVYCERSAFIAGNTASIAQLTGVSDSTWLGVNASASNGDGWQILNGNSNRYVACHGEGNTGFGFNLTGAAGFGGTAAFLTFVGCSGENNGTVTPTGGDFQLQGTGTGTYYFDFCHGRSAAQGKGPVWTYSGTNLVRTPAAYTTSTVTPVFN